MFLIIGGDSEIGAATAHHLFNSGHAVAATTRRSECVAPNRPSLDLSSVIDSWEPPPGTCGACFCAAVSRLADCQHDPVGSARVNVTQTIALCERLIARGIYVLFLSTNQVFDGTVPNVPPEAPTCPLSEYGRQKAQAEASLKKQIHHGAPAAILRLARVVSPTMVLLRDWISLLSAGLPITAFHDMTLAPIPIDTVVDVIVHLLDDQARGIFQLSGPCDISYEALARHVARRVIGDDMLVHVTSTESAELPIGTGRRHTTLDSTLLQKRYAPTRPDPWIMLDGIISKHLAEHPLDISYKRRSQT